MSQEKTREERLAEFQATKAAREASEEKRLREELEDVEMKFDADRGPRGREWDLVMTQDGPIVVDIGTELEFKKFSESKKTQIDVENFVRPRVRYPDAAKYMALASKRPAYAVRVANALCTLYGVKSQEQDGKF